MNEEIISKIVHEISMKRPRYGKCSVEFQFHDNRIANYSIVTTERHNLEAQNNKKEQENGSK